MLWLCIRLPPLTREALEPLAAWAYQWSSQIHYRAGVAANNAADRLPDAALWLEIEASTALFGGHTTLLRRIASELMLMGYSHTLGLAPSIEGAALLARAATQVALDIQTLARRLAPLPLQLLALPQTQLAALADAGLTHIGELLALPADAIARRFGPATSLYLRRLTAHAPDPHATWQPPPIYQTRCEFDFEVRDTTALRFPLQRLLLQFQGYLRAMDRGVQRFTLQLEHHQQAPTILSLGLASPGRDAAQFALLLRERLDTIRLSAPVHAMGLTALELTAPTVVQPDFFGAEAQQTQQLQQLLDRLRARLGDASVQGLTPHADHRPERAFRFVAAECNSSGHADADCAPRPCWLLPAFQRIESPQQVLDGPERIESGWWDGHDCARDYYCVHAPSGQQQWVFHDLREDRWYLHGLWA